MKAKLLFYTSILAPLAIFSQTTGSTFLTWMKGDNAVNQIGVYGTQGTAASSNKPGARDFSATWKDNAGNLWLFGGNGFDGTVQGYLNDLWKFSPSSNQWTWVKGDNTINQAAKYGTMGTPKATNKPGAIYASISWTDNNGNLWLFGGFGYTDNNFGYLNDLWKYDPLSNQWTWIKGDKTIGQPGIYGTMGTTNIANKPGARYGSRTWTDNNGKLWLFGGYGLDNAGAEGNLNDLWKYDPSTNQWTWVNGDKIVDQRGVYGTRGVASATNKPGARYVSVSWRDNNNNFWLFGGSGFDGSTAGSLNDLWKYDLSNNQWTWIKGDSMIDRPGSYGELGIASANSRPGGRYVSVSWTDASNNLWLFGGYGLDTAHIGYLNDLWKYDPTNNNWQWVKGDKSVDQLGIYGVQGMPSVINKSGSRTSSVSWTGGTGDLWLFGGYGYDDSSSGSLNDLWKISNFGVPLPLQLINFNGVLANDISQLQWQTEQETSLSHFTVERSFDGLHFAPLANVMSRGNVNRSDYDFNDDLHACQNKKIYYRLRMTDNDGHFSFSKVLCFEKSASPLVLHVFPNPATDIINVSFDQNTGGMATITITDMNGTQVYQRMTRVAAGRASLMVDTKQLPAATYILSIRNSSDKIMQQKFVVTHP